MTQSRKAIVHPHKSGHGHMIRRLARRMQRLVRNELATSPPWEEFPLFATTATASGVWYVSLWLNGNSSPVVKVLGGFFFPRVEQAMLLQRLVERMIAYYVESNLSRST